MFATSKLNWIPLTRLKLGKLPKLVTMCIVAIKYIKILSKSDQMFQKSFLSVVEVDWIAQSL
jgi:hypothetical protein